MRSMLLELAIALWILDALWWAAILERWAGVAR
jgi:hypothetical protein